MRVHSICILVWSSIDCPTLSVQMPSIQVLTLPTVVNIEHVAELVSPQLTGSSYALTHYIFVMNSSNWS